jgi:hypothetical protein
MAISLATWQTYLDEAYAGYHKLMLGASVVRVSSPDGSVEFTASDPTRALAHIRWLEAVIANGGSIPTSSYRPIYLTY